MITVEPADSRWCDSCGMGTSSTKAIRVGTKRSAVVVKLCSPCREDLITSLLAEGLA